MTKEITLKIKLTHQNKLQIILIDSQGKETPFLINKNKEINPSISFHENSIICFKQNENQFMNEWINNPHDYKFYSIQFQGKEYQLLSEVLFAIIMNEIKQIIEKDFIIKYTEIVLFKQNEELLNRIKISLQAIGLKNIKINENEIHYDYKDQGEMLNELLEKKNEIDKYNSMINRAIKMTQSEEKKEFLKRNKNKIYSEESFQENIQMKLNREERNTMKLFKLDNYCLFIASRYFSSLEDHINLIKVSKRLRGNMEKFHYNPISLNLKTMKYFPNIETLHCYFKKDKYLYGGRISQYVDWRKRKLCQIEKLKEKNKNKSIEFKRIILTEEDLRKQLENENKDIVIPEGINEIDEETFSFCSLNNGKITFPSSLKSLPQLFDTTFNVKQIHLPQNLTTISHFTFAKLIDLEELVISTRYQFQGDRLFIVTEKCLHSVALPSSLTKLNERIIEINHLKQYTIPSNVTKLNDFCFANCEQMKQIKGIEQIKEFGKGCFINCPKLNKNNLPQTKQLIQNTFEYLKSIITVDQIKHLRKWTGLQCVDIIFDSQNDHWEFERKILNERIIGKKQLVFLIETIFGEKFGYYLNPQIRKKYITPFDPPIQVDKKTFHFNLQSNDKHMNKPMKFEIKNVVNGGYNLIDPEESCTNLIFLGDIILCNKTDQMGSICSQNENSFDYHGVKNPFNEKLNDPFTNENYFSATRLVIIQMQ